MHNRVMIVEDDAIPALELAVRLKRWGYEVVRAEARGARAIESARTDEPDLVIMDVRLADGVDGVAAADRIQAELDIPILFLTATGDRRGETTDPVGRRMIVAKPYDPVELREALRRLLG